jgi:hypothetical protein
VRKQIPYTISFALAVIFTLGLTAASGPGCEGPIWGFFGHRLINRMAVYTLPPELMVFYKKNINYISEQSVAPDMRRYATKHEGVRHYIDIDVWDKPPFNQVPRDFEEAIIWKAELKAIRGLDTFNIKMDRLGDSIALASPRKFESRTSFPLFVKFWKKVIKPQYYEDEWSVTSYDLIDIFPYSQFDKYFDKVIIIDHFSEHGICPYHLEDMLRKLTYAFEAKDYEKVLRYTAEFGHYIADAHVPLHTTKNYNGQLSDQVGIHAFWESRIPELFAERDYDFFVGKPEYIEDPKTFFWDIIIDSHVLLDSVLNVEKNLSKVYPSDQQYCYDERLGTTLRIQCPEYTEAYTNAMGTMVEDRMRSAIHAISSCIYTAWANAGQPNLKNVPDIVFKEADEEVLANPKVKARPHDN